MQWTGSSSASGRNLFWLSQTPSTANPTLSTAFSTGTQLDKGSPDCVKKIHLTALSFTTDTVIYYFLVEWIVQISFLGLMCSIKFQELAHHQFESQFIQFFFCFFLGGRDMRALFQSIGSQQLDAVTGSFSLLMKKHIWSTLVPKCLFPKFSSWKPTRQRESAHMLVYSVFICV